MAPVNSYAVADAVSMQVLSHDETSILVEAGGFTPMRWFLERGAHHMQAAEDDIENEQPPKKRTNLSLE
jgi:E3 ubiquitin-protein ligase SHPRH